MATDNRGWVSDEDLVAMQLERTVRPNETYPQRAQRLFDENCDVVAMQIVQLARSAHSETVKLKAGQYVIDRVLGRVGEARQLDPTKKDPFDDLFDVVTRSATESEEAAIKKAKGIE